MAKAPTLRRPKPKKAVTPEKVRAAETPRPKGKSAQLGPPATAVESPPAKRGMLAKAAKAVPPPPAAPPVIKKKPKPKKRKAPPRPRGRPSIYTKALAAEICQRIAAGEYLSDICRDEKMPTPQAIQLWIAGDRKQDKEDALEEGFSCIYARAQDADCDRRLKEIEHIARTPVEFSQTLVKQETVGNKTKTVKEVRKGDSVPHRQLLTSNLQWIATRQHWRRLAVGKDRAREEEDGTPADGELHVIIEGGLPADGAEVMPELPSDPFTDEQPT